MLAEDEFIFLSEKGAVRGPKDWTDPARTPLWLYNLHYFDDLHARDADPRTPWHRALIERWIAENEPGKGLGWEPYPTSLRLVNWIKWIVAGNDADPRMVHSIAVQTRWLTQRLEHHLLGNHLIANAKALVFSGLFFDGAEARRWYDLGMKLLVRELAEQILADGGHFELSPMYHHIMLEDLLDLINVHRAYGIDAPAAWPDLAARMLEWSAVMCHPDGEIAFFNDAAFAIAPTLHDLQQYAGSLGLPLARLPTASAIHLRDSGYARLSAEDAVVLADLAPIGPDYLPAHAHADTLSFEMFLHGRRLIVNGGTSVYGTGPERQRQRSTEAHATLTLDNTNSSEVWGGFRVARRARVLGADVSAEGGQPRARASHDGYARLPGKPMHHRAWQFGGGELIVRDRVEGSGEHEGKLVFPLGPGLTARRTGGQTVEILDTASPQPVALVEFGSDGDVFIEPNVWHPRFGETVQTERIGITFAKTPLPFEHETRIRWGGR